MDLQLMAIIAAAITLGTAMDGSPRWHDKSFDSREAGRGGWHE